MDAMLNWMQSAELVVDFQQYFGVHSIPLTGQQQQKQQQQQQCDDNGRFDGGSDNEDSDKGGGGNKTPPPSSQFSPSMTIYRRIIGTPMVGTTETQEQEQHQPKSYRVDNWFWYRVFTLASLTGDELFYTLFFPFWQWNVDGAVIRRVILVWMITMYIGQALKDVLQVPRPSSPPVVRLDSKWVLEFGLPSTHAAVSLALPSTLLICSYQRYEMCWQLCSAVVALWSLLVSASRLYLGMHTLLDLVCGQVLAVLLLLVLVPLMDVLDGTVLRHPLSPLVLIILTVAMVAAYPSTASWNPARGDTAVILGVGCGSLVGAWLNYQLGVIAPPPHLGTPPTRYPILWPSLPMAVSAVGRTVLGLVLLMLLRTAVRSIAMRVLCALTQVKVEDYLGYNSSKNKQSGNSKSIKSDTVCTENAANYRKLSTNNENNASSYRKLSPNNENNAASYCKLSASNKNGTANASSYRKLSSSQHCFIECGYKLMTYISIGFFIAFLAPALFRAMGVERTTYSTEV